MPRTKASTAAVKSAEAGKPMETEEQVELVADNDMDEEEEVEYEEVEEEEVEEVEEEFEEEEEEEETNVHGHNAQKGYGDHDVENAESEEELKRQQAELLALPPHGSEVYIGGITHDTSEDDLKHFCESIGEVTEVRIMKGKDSNENKGYAFVTFRTRELASKAMKELNNTELKGKKLKCSLSQAKNKLFIGNVPRNWGEVDIKKVVNKVGPGVVVIELLKDPQNSSRNRGFVFIEYYNHACAEYSRQKMSDPKFKLDDNAPTVSWADPKSAESSSSQVKAVYVKNLPKDITQDQLKELFERHGKITKVVLPPAKSGQEKSRYGFVHFAERSSAKKALKNIERYEIGGQVVECSLAKPQTVKELMRAFNDARDDNSIGVIIFTGKGTKAFCSGGDQSLRGKEGYVDYDNFGRLNVLDLQVQIRRLPKPVIAMVAGYAVGGGHVLHMVCDLTIAADNAVFGQTGPKVGSFDAGYGASVMSRLVGPKRAREMWFMARFYNANEAEKMGLVNTVVQLENLEEETIKWCREILRNSPMAIRLCKSAINAADDGHAGLQQIGGDATLLFYGTEEGSEGKNAYLERRKPDFSRFPRLP